MLGLRFTVACYRTFGWLISMPLIHAVVAYFFLTDRNGRAASRGYLERVHAALTPEERRGWRPGFFESFLHYREFALAITDRVALWGGREERFDFEFEGQEKLEGMLSGGRGVILLGAHLGSFDALRVLSRRDGVPVNVLMYTRNAAQINRVFEELSPETELRVIHADPGSVRTAFEVRACIERGEFVAILADRVEPGERGRTIPVDFLGGRATLPEAPFLLPLALRCPAVAIVALRQGRGRYTVLSEPLSDGMGRGGAAGRNEQVAALAGLYARQLEHHCLRFHRQWFNFFDFWPREEAQGMGGAE
jgi:predicted LPLAT superfamily acyltransferase